MIPNVILIDNCIDNIDSFRERALQLNYTKSEPDSNGWKGYRCLEENIVADELISIISNKITHINPIFDNSEYRYYFHYSLDENNLDINKIHKDSRSDYAGVLYMSPNPIENSGTSFYNDMGNPITKFDNIYNRLILYPSNEWHSLNNSFGDSIHNGRLTFTIFCSLKQKDKKSII